MKVRGIGKKLFRVLSRKDCDAMSYWILAVLVAPASVYSRKGSQLGGLSLFFIDQSWRGNEGTEACEKLARNRRYV